MNLSGSNLGSECEDKLENPSPRINFETVSITKILEMLFTNYVYVCILLSITFLYYIVAGITYWAPNYLLE
jgi:sugar phosphate permease